MIDPGAASSLIGNAGVHHDVNAWRAPHAVRQAHPRQGGERQAGLGLDLPVGDMRHAVALGPGVVAQLLLACSPDELDAVLISHMHTDHFLDLVTLRYAFPWLDEARRRLTVHVPPGSAEQLQDLARGAGYPDFFARSFDFVEHDGERAIEIGDQLARFVEHAGRKVEVDEREIRRLPGQQARDGRDGLGHRRAGLTPRDRGYVTGSSTKKLGNIHDADAPA